MSFHLPVIPLRPEMASVRHVDQLGSDAQTVTSSAYASFKDRSHIQLFPDEARSIVFP